MNTVQKCKMILFVGATIFMIYVAFLAIQFGNKLSAQTEKTFADAIRTMQNK